METERARDITFVSAVGIAAEVGDVRRFLTAGKSMSDVGMVPSEHSSEQKEKRGSITRCGNAIVRRLLVEAVWHCRHKPSKYRAIALRNKKYLLIVVRERPASRAIDR